MLSLSWGVQWWDKYSSASFPKAGVHYKKEKLELKCYLLFFGFCNVISADIYMYICIYLQFPSIVRNNNETWNKYDDIDFLWVLLLALCVCTGIQTLPVLGPLLLQLKKTKIIFCWVDAWGHASLALVFKNGGYRRFLLVLGHNNPAPSPWYI